MTDIVTPDRAIATIIIRPNNTSTLIIYITPHICFGDRKIDKPKKDRLYPLFRSELCPVSNQRSIPKQLTTNQKSLI